MPYKKPEPRRQQERRPPRRDTAPRAMPQEQQPTQQESTQQESTQQDTQAPAQQQMRAPMQRTSPSNHIFVGQKPVMSYAMSALIQLTQAGEVVVKARGMAISRAVDVAEIVTKRLSNGQFSVKDIVIDTEVVGEGSEQRNISSIEIVVGR